MKAFKKRRTVLPDIETIRRLIRRKTGNATLRDYNRSIELLQFSGIPSKIIEVSLARPDLDKRGNIAYCSDLRDFALRRCTNRSVPTKKFLESFRGFIDSAELDAAIETLTNYRLEICTTKEDWIRVYDDDNVHSCMSQSNVVGYYVHPENNLALAALYAPGGTTVIARAIINQELKWYVRLFGDKFLVTKLNELGYRKLSETPPEFKMFGHVGENYDPLRISPVFPYFDFKVESWKPLMSTYDPTTGMIEFIINEGIK